MSRETISKILFLTTLVGTGLGYYITSAEGYPLSASTHWALAWSGVLPPLPHMSHPVWGYFVRVFDGHYIALSVAAASLATALLATVVTRHFGWRVGAAAAVFIGLSPLVWNNAVTGGRLVSLLAVGAIALWLADLWITHLVLKYKADLVFAHGGRMSKLAWLWRIAAWCVLGASGVFAAVSLTFHNYSLGEDATAYARDVLDGADGKWVAMGGLVDDQFYAEVHDAKRRVELLSLRDDELYRTQLVARVKAAFADEQDLVNAAVVGPRVFLAALRKAHPELVVMTDLDRLREKFAEAEKAGRLPPHAGPSLESLVEWSNKMMQAMDVGKTEEAARLARAILSVPEWSAFIPANIVMGTVSGLGGDYVASERFFRTVVAASTNDPPAVVCNDFAETLRQLKKLDEAEAYARKAVAQAGPKNFVSRLTLIRILDEAKGDGAEIRRLVLEALNVAPKESQDYLRDCLRRYSKSR